METITVSCTVNVPLDRVWNIWTTPHHITKWFTGTDEWHTPKAENDLKNGGKFNFRMEAKDGSAGFDFTGIYDIIKPKNYIEYTISDGRKVITTFFERGNKTDISTNLELELEHTEEQQREGWQNIMNNFKKYCEADI